jgi:predicted enzyme related to lactoylglutathione lyase
MDMKKHRPGTPLWTHLAAADPAAATEFYSRLFGWTQADAEAEQVFLLGGRPVAGIGPVAGEAPAAWRTHFAVADVERTSGLVQAAGGMVVVPAQEVAGGIIATVADPSGAAFALSQSGPGSGVVAETGAYAWSELISDNVEASAAFYGTVFGWRLGEVLSDPSDRRDWLLEQEVVAGLLPRPAAMPSSVPPYWDVYFEVADVEECVGRAASLGATVLMSPIEIAHGRIAVFADPSGIPFSVVKPADTHI